MSLLKKYKELPEETKTPIEVVAACETAGAAVMSLAALADVSTAISGFACGIIVTTTMLATAVLGNRVHKSIKKTLDEQKAERVRKSIKKTLDEQKAENAQAEEAYKA